MTHSFVVVSVILVMCLCFYLNLILLRIKGPICVHALLSAFVCFVCVSAHVLPALGMSISLPACLSISVRLFVAVGNASFVHCVLEGFFLCVCLYTQEGKYLSSLSWRSKQVVIVVIMISDIVTNAVPNNNSNYINIEGFINQYTQKLILYAGIIQVVQLYKFRSENTQKTWDKQVS